MYEKIVVPLDGSKLAECVLPYVEELAKGCDTKEVILVSVTERIASQAYLSVQHPQLIVPLPIPAPIPTPEAATQIPVSVGKQQRQAQRYLNRIAKQLKAKKINVRYEVLLGNPADEITTFAEQTSADLITMASHGRSGPSRWAHGSVADKVFRASCVPILMVRAPGCVLGI